MTAPTKTCPICEGEKDTVESRHRNTMYQDEPSNWLESCKECFDEDWEHFQELWDDINSDVRASCYDALRSLN